MVGCSGSEGGESSETTSLMDRLEAAGGSVVEDTSASWDEGLHAIRAGGLVVPIPELKHGREWTTDKTFHPQWPILSTVRYVGDGPLVGVAVAVLKQQVVVVDDAIRADLVAKQVYREDPYGSRGWETLLDVELSGSDPERSCWVRVDQNPDPKLSLWALVMVVGPELPAMGWTMIAKSG